MIYCYANGIFSSRRIERATHRDIGVRFVAANRHPDHDTIARFRRENFAAVSESFLQVLLLAKELKLLRVGLVSVDASAVPPPADRRAGLRRHQGGARLRRVLAARPREGRGRVDPGGSRLQLQALAQAEPGGVRRLDQACRDRGRAPTPRSATKPANGLYREETSANSARCQNHRRQIHIQSMTSKSDRLLATQVAIAFPLSR